MRYNVEEYISENPMAWELFQSFTKQAIGAGRRRIGAKMIAERIRWETYLRKTGDFKFNNNYTAGMARKFMAENPQYGDIFQTRGADNATEAHTESA